MRSIPFVQCDAPGCVRGLVHRSDGWADPCKLCEGTGVVSMATLCRLIGEVPGTVSKLNQPRRRMRVKTCTRILEKLAQLLQWEDPMIDGGKDFTGCDV
jgi:hypothetical protein